LGTNAGLKTGGITGNRNPMLHQNLSQLIRWYKGHITFKSRKINPDFAWQPRFHDHIVRDEIELNRIRLYIKQNPEKWQFDRENRNSANRVCEPDVEYNNETWMV
jgi:hypothetical protein